MFPHVLHLQICITDKKNFRKHADNLAVLFEFVRDKSKYLMGLAEIIDNLLVVSNNV